MVSSPDDKGVIIFGGKHWNGTWNLSHGTYPNQFLELRYGDNQWRKLPKSLQYPRENFLALSLSSERSICV